MIRSQINQSGDNISGDSYVNRSASPVYVTLLSAATTLTNICLGGSTMCAIVFLNSYAASTSMKQHVCLCVIGYVFLMAQAVQSLNPHSGWARLVRYQDRRVIHWMLQIVGSVLVIVGSIMRMVVVPNNFTTPHGILGLIAFFMTISSMVCGVVSAYSKKLKLNPTYLKLAHSCLGSLTLCAAFFSLCLAFNKTARPLMGDKNADIAIGLTVCGLIGTLLSPCADVIVKVAGYFKYN